MTDDFEQELLEHPFFAQRVPDNIQDNEAFSAMQALVYEDPPPQVCINFKNNADDYLKKYTETKKKQFLKNALTWYDKAMTVDGLTEEDEPTRVLVLANRCQAHLYAHNYRSALADGLRVLKFSPSHVKAAYRAMTAAFELKQPDIVVSLYNNISKHCTSLPKSLHTLYQKASVLEQQLQKKREYEQQQIQIKEQKLQQYEDLLERHGVLIGPSLVNIADDCVSNTDLPFWEQDGQLFGKILLFFPEFNTSDLLKEVCFDASCEDILSHVFEVPLSNEYTFDNVDLYYRQSNNEQQIWSGDWIKIPRSMELRKLVGRRKYKYICPKVCSFFVFVTGGEFARRFMQ
ncbi:hypothetical protein P9112_009893 [Eukaryota sp. TZLM1-RC]